MIRYLLFTLTTILCLSTSVGFASDEVATLAGGCFWCMFPPFAKKEGIIKLTAGYTGGNKDNPTYHEVSSGTTGHVEAVEIVFDPQKISYEKILDKFWRSQDPTDPTGQFADRGPQYRSIIFYHNEKQRKLAKESKLKLENSHKFNKKIVTQIRKAEKFWPAEAEHQEYYLKNPGPFQEYEQGSGRESFLQKYWGK